MKSTTYSPFALRDEQRAVHYKKAFDQAHAAAGHLYARGATRVTLFGSILSPEAFDEHSDIDIAVEGIRDFFTQLRIESELMDIIRDADFDVVFLDGEQAVLSHIRQAIEEKGQECLR